MPWELVYIHFKERRLLLNSQKWKKTIGQRACLRENEN